MTLFRVLLIRVCVFLAVLLFAAPPVFSETDGEEYEIKSVFTLKMLPYISWNTPGEKGGEKVLGVYQGDSYFEIIQELLNESKAGIPLRLKKITRLDQLSSCDILLVGKMDPDDLMEVLEATSGASILTIGEQGEFLSEGGIVNFILENKRVRFQINIHAAEKSGIKISSKLLKLAQSIKRN